MGRASRKIRHYPKRLGEKLYHIRTALGISQNGMIERLGSPEGLLGTSISGYERGVREPPLLILLKYSHIAGVYLEVLVDDNLNLPQKLPASPRSKGVKRQKSSKN
jgi:transcriptional regulator with XRE-family HTH domain